MEKLYTNERAVQTVITLLKAHGVRYVIASPGVKNIAFVGSIQNDPDFRIFSAVDERSAAYMACGIAAETGEPVVLTCTEATAPRNYFPGLTEAYYRHLPLVVLTSTWGDELPGHLVPQSLDQTVFPRDVVKCSCQLPVVKDDDDAWLCNTQVNRALIEMRRDGGGPVHIGLSMRRKKEFTEKTLPDERLIKFFTSGLDAGKKLREGSVGIFVGSHAPFSDSLTQAVDKFCEKFGGVVYCDHTSNYHGKYGVLYPLMRTQVQMGLSEQKVLTLLHLGEVTGAYAVPPCGRVWRVHPDGEVRDTFKKLTRMYQMDEEEFFRQAVAGCKEANKPPMATALQQLDASLRGDIPELPFSNIYLASQLTPAIPAGSAVHLGILNSLRAWNFFPFVNPVRVYSNVGGFGIDGCLSSLLGAAMVRPEQLFFGIFGDLSFFYDLNALGNRQVSNNVRILLVNNGRGVEFRNYNNPGEQYYGDSDKYIAAAGHFGQQSPDLVRHYAQDLGLKYLSADSKESFQAVRDQWLTPKSDKPILLEVFTQPEEESRALYLMYHLRKDSGAGAMEVAKGMAKKLLGESGTKMLKNMLKG